MYSFTGQDQILVEEHEDTTDNSIFVGSKDLVLLARLSAILHVLFEFAENVMQGNGSRLPPMVIRKETVQAAYILLSNSRRQKQIICEVGIKSTSLIFRCVRKYRICTHLFMLISRAH